MGANLTLKGLSKRYGNAVAVHSVSLDVAQGEFVSLLGASGSGKTTTLMMIAGFTPPDRGEIILQGRAITRLPPEQRGIGVVFQNYALFPHMSVLHNVAFPLRMRGVASAPRAVPRRAGRSSASISRASRSASRRSFPAASSSALRSPAHSSSSQASS
jgi:putative spermidine/putrescine transport system ATP-binding protein